MSAIRALYIQRKVVNNFQNPYGDSLTNTHVSLRKDSILTSSRKGSAPYGSYGSYDLDLNPRYKDKEVIIIPDDPETYNRKGTALCSANDPTEAIYYFDEAISLNPSYYEAYNNKGTALVSIEMYEKAIECFQKAISLKPEYITTYYNKATALVKLKKYEEAIAVYDTIISLKPNDACAFYNKGNVLSSLKDYTEAIETYDQAISLKANYAGAYYSKGLALQRLEKYEEAYETYTQALSIVKTNSLYYFNRGIILTFLGREEEAQEDFEKADDLLISEKLANMSEENIEFLQTSLEWISILYEIKESIRVHLETKHVNESKFKDVSVKFQSLQQAKKQLIQNIETSFEKNKEQGQGILSDFERMQIDFQDLLDRLQKEDEEVRLDEVAVGVSSERNHDERTSIREEENTWPGASKKKAKVVKEGEGKCCNIF